MFNWEFPYPSQRMPVLAKIVVATSQPLAAQAGLQALYRVGNAVDAALAAAITLTVVEPTSTFTIRPAPTHPDAKSNRRNHPERHFPHSFNF